jgi:serine/threonine protein kinase/WD40 repeat protein
MPTLFDQLLNEPDLLGADQLKELKRLPEAADPDPRALAKILLQKKWLTRYQINEVAAGRAKGLRIGPYIVLDRLGEGGMGQVLKARHEHMGRVVALKLIRKEKLEKANSVARFYQEVKAAAALIHPNIVMAFDAGQAGGTHFFSMEYVAGTDLARLVNKDGPLPVAQACEYIRQAAIGLQHAHERGLVHRDIKPSNLLVSAAEGSSPVVKLLDLGLARLGDSFAQDTHLTKMGQVLGTPDYLAPEQALDSRSVDIRADIYSLGCTLFFLLTGRPPFQAEALAHLLLKHQMEAIPNVRELRPDAPEGLALLLQRMLAKKPEQRPAIPTEVAAALEPFASRKQTGAVQAAGAVEEHRIRPPASGDDFADLTADEGVVARFSSSRRDRSGDTVAEGPAKERKRPRERGGEKNNRLPILIGASIGGGTLLLAGIGVLLYVLLSGGKPADQSSQSPQEQKGPDTPVRPPKPIVPAKAPVAKSADDGTLFGGIEAAVKGGTTARSRMLGGSAGETDFLDVPGEGGLLTGLIIGIDSANGQGCVKSLQPIYSTRKGRVLGSVHGEMPRFLHNVEAKPGYAVGSVTIQARGVWLDALAVTFMAIDGTRLDPGRFYQQGWFGDARGKPPISLVGEGTPIVGIFGKVNRITSGLGLVSLAAPKGPPAIPPLAVPAPPSPPAPAPVARVEGEVRSYRLARGGVTPVCFFKDAGQALIPFQKEVRLCNLERLDVVRTYSASDSRQLSCLAVSPDGKTLAAGDIDGRVYLWDVESASERRRLERASGVQDLAFSPDSKSLAATGGGVLVKDGKWVVDSAGKPMVGDHGVDLWNVETGKKEHRFEAAGRHVRHGVFSGDGKQLLAGVDPLWVWGVQTRQVPAGFQKPALPFVHCLAAVEKRLVLLGAPPGDIVLWNLDASRVVKTFRGHSSQIHRLAVLPGGKQFVSLAGNFGRQMSGQPRTPPTDATLRLWDVGKGIEVGRTTLPEVSFALAVSPEGTHALVGDFTGLVRLIDLRKLPAPAAAVAVKPPEPTPAVKPAEKFAGHTGVVTSIAYSPDGKYLLSGGKEGTARLWDAKTGTEVHKLSPGGPVSCVCFSGNGKRLGVFAKPFSRVYDTARGTLELSFSPSVEDASVVGCLSDTGMEAVATGTRWVGCYKAQPGRPFATSHTYGNSAQVTCAAYSPDGSFFAYGDAVGMVRIRSTLLDKEVGSYAAHNGAVTCLAVAGGKTPRVISGGADKVIVLRSGTTLTIARKLSGHEGPLTSLSLSADGKQLASGSSDRTIRVWSLSPPKQLHKFTDEDAVLGVAFAPDGKVVASCGVEGIRFWKLTKTTKP